MKTLNLIIVFLLSVFISSTAYSQECRNFFNSNTFKKIIPKDFKDYGQAINKSVEINETNNFEIVFNGNEEYLMIIAAEPGYGPVHFRILTPDNKMVLFDNETKKFNESANFYMQKTQSLSVEVTVMNTNEKNAPSKVKLVCLGIKINNRHYTE